MVNFDGLEGPSFVEQVKARLASNSDNDLAVVTLGRSLEATADKDQQHAWRVRAMEDVTAVGGLRNPVESVKKLKGTAAMGDKLQTTIDEAMKPMLTELKEGLNTLGSGEMPQVFADTARGIREQLGKMYGVSLAEEG